MCASHPVPYGGRPMSRVALNRGVISHASKLSANCSTSFRAVATAMESTLLCTRHGIQISHRHPSFPKVPAGIDIGFTCGPVPFSLTSIETPPRILT